MTSLDHCPECPPHPEHEDEDARIVRELADLQREFKIADEAREYWHDMARELAACVREGGIRLDLSDTRAATALRGMTLAERSGR